MLARAYEPRRPEQTLLYDLVLEHLETFLQYTRESYAKPLPAYVEQEFREYLDCGIFSKGFTRCHCDHCGHDLLVAFSCKNRGICPSCTTRRMSNTAAHLVDRVVPEVPVRQYVLSLPFELRKVVAFRADVLTAASRIFSECVLESIQGACGVRGGVSGAVMFVQRFGGSLNLNVHFHLMALDGVFEKREGELVFHRAPEPKSKELAKVVERTEKRLLRWFKRRNLLDHDDTDATEQEADALERCATIAMSRGTFGAGEEVVKDKNEDARFEKRQCTAQRNSFSLHAGVRIDAGDDEGRERLFRYGGRPPLSLERLSVLDDGRIAYRVKYPRDATGSLRMMTPMDFMARLAALIPPPRYPLVRYFGVLAPNSKWRKLVVPQPRSASSTHGHGLSGASTEGSSAKRAAGNASAKASSIDNGGVMPTITSAAMLAMVSPVPAIKSGSMVLPLPGIMSGAMLPMLMGSSSCAQPACVKEGACATGAESPSVIRLGPNMVSIKHWERLENGALMATSPRVDWTRLLKRGLDVDSLECPKCHGRLRVMAVIMERETARKICEHIGLPGRAPARARARGAGEEDGQLSMGW